MYSLGHKSIEVEISVAETNILICKLENIKQLLRLLTIDSLHNRNCLSCVNISFSQ